jgi:hypothetical protein
MNTALTILRPIVQVGDRWLWRLVCIRSASRADSVQAVLRPAVLRSTDDSKADICDGTADSGGESFGGPVFAGVRGGNLARSRSSPAAEPGLSERAGLAGSGAAEADGGGCPAWGGRSSRGAELAESGELHRIGEVGGDMPWRYGGRFRRKLVGGAAAQSCWKGRSCFWGTAGAGRRRRRSFQKTTTTVGTS